jgi:hypothetical protein
MEELLELRTYLEQQRYADSTAVTWRNGGNE